MLQLVSWTAARRFVACSRWGAHPDNIEIGCGATPVALTLFARAFHFCMLEWTAERGADELICAYEKASLTLDDSQGRCYTRLQQLKGLIDATALDERLRWTAQTPADTRAGSGV